jgi:hypothetical protein
MNQLGRESRALVDAARDGDDPLPEDRARVRRRLVQLGVGVALTTVASGTAAATAASMGGGAGGAGAVATGAAASIAPGPLAASGTLLTTSVVSSFGVMAVKVVAAVVLVGGIGTASVKGVSVYRAHQASVASQAAHTTHTTTPVAAPAPVGGAQETSPVAAAPVAIPSPSVVEPSPPPTGQVPATNPPPSSGARSTAATSRGVSDTLKAEYTLLRGAEGLRVGGDPSAALANLDEYAARFPRGVLAEEYAAQRVLTLCDLGRVADAKVEGRRFLLEHPHSPLAEHVRESCARVSP